VRIGFNLPQFGPVVTPTIIVQAAQKAEALGYDSLWVAERLLYPVHPQTPYPASPDGKLPEVFKHVMDPLEVLTFAAAHTSRVALGTSVLVISYHNPVVLARRLATLDVLSGGRVRVGLGLGWSKDEFDAVGASLRDRGRRADEFLHLLKAIWTSDPVEFRGEFYHVPRSYIGPKPVQKPHPPIYMAAFAPDALKRTAVLTNGWNPAGVPVEGMTQMITQLREMGKAAGRDPKALEIVVRANLYVTPRSLGTDRSIFTGSLDQIRADVAQTRSLGANELFFDATFALEGNTAGPFLACMEQVRQIV
jgi:probable F420-dependent oxidoreductase